jgi:hypothetical protein
MNRITTSYIIGLVAVSLAIGIAAVIALKALTTNEWMRDNRHAVTTIIGASIIAPWLVAIVRMRRPA